MKISILILFDVFIEIIFIIMYLEGEVKMKKSHGIMFHHFFDGKTHLKGQGAISMRQFSDLLDYYSERYNIIDAQEYLERKLKNKLSDNDVCITFDDGLLCQYDIAYPVLKERGLTAFFFIYTSPLCGVIEKIELYRHFRTSQFKHIDEFYEVFFDTVRRNDKKIYLEMKKCDTENYLKDFPFYSKNDRLFRYLRDEVLKEKQYESMMDSLIREKNYDIEVNQKILWLKENQIRKLNDDGNIIGLHSHTHSTVLEQKTFNYQMNEYKKNKEILETLVNNKIITASYPCNSYNKDTLKVMKELGIKMAFRANMESRLFDDDFLECAREDHANIIKYMEENK